jgi:hypothetical protein
LGILLGESLTVKYKWGYLQEIKVVRHQSSANAKHYSHLSGEETLETGEAISRKLYG